MMRKLTRLLTLAVVFAALMTFITGITSVSFAGTKSDKVTVRYICASPEEIAVCYDDLEVRGDLVEKYFPDFALYEPEKGVSYLDALVAACIRKTGNVKDIELVDPDGSYAWVAKLFGENMSGAIVNGITVSSVHNNVKSGDILSTLIYSGPDWHWYIASVFDKTDYTVTVGRPITVSLKAMTIMDRVPFDMITASLSTVDMNSGKAVPFEGAEFKNGSFTISFPKTGTYFITAGGKTAYSDNSGEYEDVDAYGALAKIVVKDIVPGKPVIKTAKRNSKTKGTVKWSKAKNAKKYQVAYRIKGTAKWTTKKVTGTSVTLKLKAKKAYQVKVRSINGTSTSAYSAVKTIRAK